MELEDLKMKWNSETNYSVSLDINNDRLQEIIFSKSKKLLSDYRFENIVELALYGFLMVYLWDFMAKYLTEFMYFLPGLILFVLSGINVAFNIYSLDFYGRLNYSSPIIGLQKRLQRIQLYMKWERYLMVILIPLYILPFLIVMAKSFLDLNLYPLLLLGLYKVVIPWTLIGTIVVVLISRSESKKLKQIAADLKEIQKFDKA